jgi:hypothetical protein
MFFFGEVYVFVQLSSIGPLGTKCAFLHLEYYDLQEVLLSKTN